MTIRPYTDLYRSEVLAIEQRLGLEACGEWSDVHEEAINAFRRRHQMELCYGMDLATEQALESIVVTAETLMRPFDVGLMTARGSSRRGCAGSFPIIGGFRSPKEPPWQRI